MKRSLIFVLLLLAMLGAITPPAQARPAGASITVVDDHHTTITLSAAPRRIISLAPNVTEILFALGLGSRVVGVGSPNNYPAAAAKLPIVYSYSGVSLEKIIALKPDLVVSAAVVPQSVVVKLRGLHLKVLVTDPHSLSGILSDIRLVGAAAGVPAVAATDVAKLQSRINNVAAALKSISSRPSVYYELDKTLYTVGHGSFMDSLITLAGGVNIAAKVANPYPQLSAEKVLTADPQYIILGDAAYGITAAQVGARPGWSAIAAVKLHHVFGFNDDLASRPGPRIVDGLEKLAHILHPEAFQ
jgi:iron complex transport system substrate-binding protein